ncbi:hypothetical protein WICPIJ_003108 [Wickerhamomyces pijperi]|uniref:Transporter SEO1 n=1 Tax=Wickerhamomyces pijperi TaxID=599730 RepID=A0A9P8QAK1_WICPI|nr:hypothetical protein WICPIJ_003108 [Wickerhamomyces pijperi]
MATFKEKFNKFTQSIPYFDVPVGYGKLRYGFIPVLREVEDLPEDLEEIEKLEKETQAAKDAVYNTVEYRDEADRPWWKFFDEYEYRINKNVRKSHKWFKWFNDSDSPAERVLITKLDILLTLYSTAAYWVKNLDSSNLNNAYVSGMKEDLGFKGNDLVHVQAVFTASGVVFQLPFLYFLYKLPMNFVLPGLDLGWSLFTLAIYRVESLGELKVLRFFVGLFESPAYLAYQFLFGCFFKYDEIVRRSMIYYIGQYLGVVTSGLLQGRIYQSLNGHNGLQGWRWFFIIDSVISVFIGIIGFYVLPGSPERCYSLWLSDDEIRLARKRLRQNNTGTSKDVSKRFFDKSLWKTVFTSWKTYLLTIWNILVWCNNNGTNGAYVLWLKSLKRYSIPKVNQLSAISPAVGILWLILCGLYADLMHSRYQAVVISQVFNFIGNVILAVWDVPEGAKWFAFMLSYSGWCMAPVNYSWANDILRHDVQVRAITMVIMNIIAQAMAAWISVLVWKTSEAPRFHKGFSWTASAAASVGVFAVIVLWFYKREEKLHARQNGIVLYNSKTGENYPLDKEDDPASASSESVEKKDSQAAVDVAKPVESSDAE